MNAQETDDLILTQEGLLLTPIKPFKKLPIRDILGCTGYQGPEKSLAQMQEGIAKGAKIQR